MQQEGSPVAAAADTAAEAAPAAVVAAEAAAAAPADAALEPAAWHMKKIEDLETSCCTMRNLYLQYTYSLDVHRRALMPHLL